MASARSITVWLTCLSLLHLSHGFGGGAPEGVCQSMTPSHNAAPQQTPSPYKVTTSKAAVAPGEQIEISVSGNGNIKGFFIRARQNNNLLDIGDFQPNALGQLRCGGKGITHNSNSPKDVVKVMWTAPSNIGPGTLQFVATVVQEKALFWTMIPSSDVTVGSTSGGATSGGAATGATGMTPVTLPGGPMTTRGLAPVTTTPRGISKNAGEASAQNPGVVSVDPQCGKTKGCYHDCGAGGPCTYLMSWLYQTDRVKFQFLYKVPATTDQWISLGLSNDQYMGDDSVMECVMDAGTVQVKTSYNSDKINIYPDDKHAGLHNYGGSIKDGVLECSFERKIEYPREPKVFNLKNAYYLMVAYGEGVAGNKFPHSYENLPKVSAQKISFQDVGSVKGGANAVYPMIKAHVHSGNPFYARKPLEKKDCTSMTFAWMFFASSGLFIARHGRSMFNNSKPFGMLVWFHIHRFSMFMTAILTIVGFALILVESKGYSKIPDTPANKSWYRMLHPPIGLVVIILTFVNPIMALFRPEPKAPSRSKFNWIHWGIGILAYILSYALILIGLDLTKSQSDVEAIYVVFAFIGYHVVMEILIRALPYLIASAWTCCKADCCRRSKRSYDLGMTEMNGSELPSMTGMASEKELDDEKPDSFNRRENVIRTFLLIFHMVASACFSIAVLYFFLKHPIDESQATPSERLEHDNSIRIVGPF